MIFFTDLDGTLIRTAERKREGDIIVEFKDGREITCISAESAAILAELDGIVPVTSRSVEQYLRINIRGFAPEFAIVDNGGNLLVNGVINRKWAEWAEEIVTKRRDELRECRAVLQNDENRSFEIRFVDERFLFTKSSDPERTIKRLSMAGTGLALYNTGVKVYAIPPEFDKGAAVARFVGLFGKRGETIVCAGDSEMDAQMLRNADIAIFPDDLKLDKQGFTCPRGELCELAAAKARELLK